MTPDPRTAALARGRRGLPLWLPLSLPAQLLAGLLSSSSGLGLVGCGGDAPGAEPRPRASAAPATPVAAPRQATAPAHGYGDQITWRGLDEGLKEAAELGRPVMLVVHAAWCPRCKELSQRFFDPALARASERFVMVNLDQDHSPEALRHGPDGTYIPRVLFLDPQGRVDATLSNPGRSKYKYFYMPQDDLVGVMNQAFDRLHAAAPPAHASR